MSRLCFDLVRDFLIRYFRFCNLVSQYPRQCGYQWSVDQVVCLYHWVLKSSIIDVLDPYLRSTGLVLTFLQLYQLLDSVCARYVATVDLRCATYAFLYE